MKFLSLVFILASAPVFATSYYDVTSSYTCRDLGDSVCAVNNSTGQCTQSWERGQSGNPMAACKRYTGQSTEGQVDWSNYYCKDWGDSVCAVNKTTGQCTQSWERRQGGNPMYRCKQQLGLLKAPPSRKGRYYCKDWGDSVCAVNKATNQCTMSWDKREGNAAYRCEQYINN